MGSKTIVQRVCAALLAAGTLMAPLAVTPAASGGEQQWREGGGLIYPLGLDLSKTEDDGVATYVGGALNIMERRHLDPDHPELASVVPSRAAEVEGLTVVDGRVELYSQHDGGWDWNNRNVRFGAVGLGSGYGPARGSVVLAVGSEGCGNSVWNYVRSTAFVAASRSDDAEHRAKLPVAVGGGCGADRTGDVLFANADGTRADWIEQVADPLAEVNGVDYRGHRQSVRDRAAQLANLKDTGTVAYGVAPADADYWRTNWRAGDVSYKFVFEGGDGDRRFAERLVTFTGDGKSTVQVFTVDAAQLDTDGWHGVSWRFDNIPEDAAVVVNVKGDAKDITFDNGWRFWFNGTEVGNAWGKDADEGTIAAFRTAASSIMWNFTDAASVRIQGGRLNNGDQRDSYLTPGNGSVQYRWGDPAAEFIGSILVPNGDLATEVSTNGRVATGGDYTMASGTLYQPNGNSGLHTRPSVLGMEQERHNFPWIGLMHLDGREVSWRKSDPDGGLLAGSRWQVYATLEDARARTNALLSVTDNDGLDLDGQDGVLAVGNLKGGHDYFIRETAAPSGYDINEHIYAADADTGTLTGVDPAAASLLGADNAVVNKRSTHVSWVKYDSGTPLGGMDGVLAGSQWEAAPDGAQQGTPVVDATVPAESVHVTRQGVPVSGLTLFQGESAQLYAAVAPDSAPRTVRWESGDTTVASVDGGLVTAGTSGTTTLTVSSGADPDVKATLEVHVTGDFTLMNGDAKYEPGGAYAVTAGEHQLTLNVDADRLPHVTSSDIHVARVRDGRLIAGEPGTARLSYTVAGQAREFTLTVVPEGVTAVFFASRHGDNIYTAAPGANTGEVICHDERKPVCTPELTGVRYEDNIRKARVTANDADWSVVYVPNENLDAFDYVVGARVGRYSWTANGAPMQSVEIKAMRGPEYANFHAPAGQIAVWMENWDNSGTGAPKQMKPSRTGDVRITDTDGDRVANTAVMSMHTGDTMKLDATVVQGTGNTDHRVYWKSTSPETATVASDGTISALNPGIADLYALSPKGVSQYVQIHVVDPDRIALYYDPEYGFDPCSADNPCVIRDKYAAYTQWSSYAQQYVVPPSQWDARDGGMSVYDTAYDTGYLMNGRPLMRVDLSRRELRDHVVVNGSNRQVYLMSRKERTVQCPTSPASARGDCVEKTGGQYASEQNGAINTPVGASMTLGSLSGGESLEDLIDTGDMYVMRNRHYGHSAHFDETPQQAVADIPGLTDEEQASLPEPDTDLDDTALALPKQANPAWEDVDTRPGFFHLAGVADGTYTLTETTAPDGYTRLEHPIRFSVRDGQVFWPEGLPVIDSTAWIANTRTGTPPNPPDDSPDTPGTPGTPSDGTTPAAPGGRPQVNADDITGVEPTLAATGMGVSMAGVTVMLLASVAVGLLAARERLRPHGRHSGRR